MDGGSNEGSEVRFAAYVEALGTVLGHADRQQPMHDYCVELVTALARQLPDKAIAPILNRTGKKTGRGNGWTQSRSASCAIIAGSRLIATANAPSAARSRWKKRPRF